MRKTGASRDSGRATTTPEKSEAHSIRQMIERAAIDSLPVARAFSSAGAILPYGCAASVQELFEAIFNVSSMPSHVSRDRVRSASIAKVILGVLMG
jgi:hypothetical protein